MIEIRDLYKSYRTGFWMKSKPVLKGIHLDVHAGEVFGFIGPNGAGKSTTIKLLLGLLRMEQGSVRVLGCAPDSHKHRSRLGYCPEHPYFYDYLTGMELLRFYGKLSGLRGEDLTQSINRALDMVHANQAWIHRRLRTYSKGMTQRIGLAQAILTQPDLLILDEPMSGLDPVGRKDVRDLITSLNKQGTTIFYSSHVLSDVESISHRVAMIIDGKIRHCGTVGELLQEQPGMYHVTVGPVSAAHQETLQRIASEVQPSVWACQTPEQKDQVLGWCLESHVAVEKVQAFRPSLEELLAKEIARG
jgi:ABC-2 type transport system ATP-binding protein